MNGLDVSRATTAGGDYSPITLLGIGAGDGPRRSEIWPDDPAGPAGLLPRGEVGVLTASEHAPDRSRWRWSVEFSVHVGRPADWRPPGQWLRR